MTVWRIGRKHGRTIYQQNDDSLADDGDTFLGMMESRDLAQFVVDAVNHFYSIDPDHPCPAVVAVNDFYGRDVIPQHHGPMLASPAEADLPVIPLDPLGHNSCATDE